MFDELTKWKNDLARIAEKNEHVFTNGLLLIALIIVLVALFGKPQHKAALAIYIVV